MENKYYVPSIEEFCVGFECEILGNVLYHPYVITREDFSSTNGRGITDFEFHIMDDLENVRVKYLDREDIESLGWGNYKKSIWDWYEIEKQFRLSSGHWGSKFILSHDRTNEFTTITDDDICHNILIKADIGGNIDTLFEGTVKNKSELKKLMKQLGIWKD